MMKSCASLGELCDATRQTLAAILAQHNSDSRPAAAGSTAVQCVAGITRLNNPRAANQAIGALIAFKDLVNVNHSVPLYNALMELDVDGICGPYCRNAAVMIDAMIDFENNDEVPSDLND